MEEILVDSHAHLDFPEFSADLDDVLDRARAAGVGYVLTVGVDVETSEKAVEIASSREGVYAAVGIHPNEASGFGPGRLREIEALARRGARAIGETGLDYYRLRASRKDQERAFREQIQLANKLRLPLIVHSRDAWDDTFRILLEEPPGFGAVIHCFSAGPGAAAQAVAEGFYLSFAGPLTYPNASRARETAAAVPLDRILIETDSPFLAPQSRRGKRNEPASAVEIAREQAALHKVTLADAARTTSASCRTLFGIGPDIPSGLIVYPIRDSLYINLTGRCTACCVFCPRQADSKVAGYDLRLPAEPSVARIKSALLEKGPSNFREVVFCGYGEPTLRLEELVEIGRWLRESGVRVRLNTNGTANLIHGRDVTGELATAVDDLSVSLNAQDAGTYFRLCRPVFGEETWDGILDFVRKARGKFATVTLTALSGLEGVDVEACRKIAGDLGVSFRERIYQFVG